MTVRINGSTGFTNGDNVKLKLGASDDLQIYHDGSDSYVTESGTGNLKLTTNGNVVDIGDTGVLSGRFWRGGASEIYHNNSKKLETTSTGVNVTGIADVSSEILVGNNNSRLAENGLRFLSGGAAYIDHGTVGQVFIFRTSNSSTLDTNAFRINADGAVGIGTNTPYSPGLSVGSTDAGATISPGGQNNHLTLTTTGSGGAIRFYTIGGTTGNRATTESMRIAPSGNIGIGETSPGHMLHLKSTGDAGIHIQADSDNVDETHNPYISFSQDGGSTQQFIIGIEGNSGQSFTGSITNASYIHAANAQEQPLQLAHNGSTILTLEVDSNWSNIIAGSSKNIAIKNSSEVSLLKIQEDGRVELPHKNDDIEARTVINPPLFFEGMWHYYYRTSGGSTSTTNKILRMNTWYWGEGGCILEIIHTYYTGFDTRSVYALRGHTNGNNNNTGVTTLVNNGGPVPYFASTIFESTGNTTNDGTNSQGYADLLIDRGGYHEYIILIKSLNAMYRLTDSSGSGYSWDRNSIWVYPNQTT